MTKVTFDALQDSFRQSVKETLQISEDLRVLLSKVNGTNDNAETRYPRELFNRLLERLDSDLLNIAFLGPFSSGKSFLISTLMDRTSIIIHSESAHPATHFVPLIPGTPRPSSSCPLVVEALPISDRQDRFWAYFADSLNWEEKSPVSPKVVGAYITNSPTGQSDADRARKVIKARLGLASAPMPARLYDLPGVGSVDSAYGVSARELIEHADCIAYVASALRPLDTIELDLLRYVYRHHRRSGKPVLFVLTQIDKAMDFDPASDKIVWETVRDVNNEFLRRYFHDPVTGDSDKEFVGEGFIAVSAALEAESRYCSAHDSARAMALKRESRMSVLRAKLDEYSSSASGPHHLSALCMNLHKLLIGMTSDIQAAESVEVTTQSEIELTLDEHELYRRMLIEQESKLRMKLSDLGAIALHQVFDENEHVDLAQFLAETLNHKILTEDVLKEEVIHELEIEKTELIAKWCTRDQNSLGPRWNRAWEDFLRESNMNLQDALVNPSLSSRIMVEINVAYDSTPLAGLGMAGLAEAATFKGTLETHEAFKVLAVLKRNKALDSRRKEMIAYLAQYAEGYITTSRTRAEEAINRWIGIVIESIDQEIDRAAYTITALSARHQSGEACNSSKRVEVLRGLLNRCLEINKQVVMNCEEISKLNPRNESVFLDKTELS